MLVVNIVILCQGSHFCEGAIVRLSKLGVPQQLRNREVVRIRLLHDHLYRFRLILDIDLVEYALLLDHLSEDLPPLLGVFEQLQILTHFLEVVCFFGNARHVTCIDGTVLI